MELLVLLSFKELSLKKEATLLFDDKKYKELTVFICENCHYLLDDNCESCFTLIFALVGDLGKEQAKMIDLILKKIKDGLIGCEMKLKM